MQDPIDAGARGVGAVDAGQAPRTQIGLGLAVLWVALGTLAGLSTVVLLLSPDVAVNVAIITVPLFVSGWCSVAAAAFARARDARTAILAPVVGGAAGFAAALVAMLIVYALVWPGYW